MVSDAGSVMHSDWDRQVVTATHGSLFTSSMYYRSSRLSPIVSGAIKRRTNIRRSKRLRQRLHMYVIDPILTLVLTFEYIVWNLDADYIVYVTVDSK